MDNKRTFLWVIFFVSAFLLFDNWQRYQGHPSMLFPSAHTSAQSTASSSPPQETVPVQSETDTPPNTQHDTLQQGVNIPFSTNLYQGTIDTKGGTLNKLTLKRAAKDQQITLFTQNNGHTYLARTGLLNGYPNHDSLYTVSSTQNTLEPDQNSLSITLTSPVQNGVQVIKTYTFSRDSYVIKVSNTIKNLSNTNINPTLYMELVRDDTPVETPMFSHTYLGFAVYNNESHFQKVSFSDLDNQKANYSPTANNGWIAMIQHYFTSAWIPQQGVKYDVYAGKILNNLYRIGIKQPIPSIAPGQSRTVSSELFAGPEEEKMLSQVAPGLELVKDYGLVTIIARPLFWLLEKIHSVVGNWGWAIVILTIIIKGIFFPLSAKSYRSMARMKELTPRMQKIRERLKDEPQKMNMALMELYKKEKVNPLGGCLPVIIQIPVFISLYWVLLSSVEMRGAPWILWIHDLSQRDPYFILPILMAVSMFIQTRLNPPPPDPLQAKLMMFMPLVFSIMFFFFPSGLVLYYVVNNLLSIIQQYYISRVMKHPKKPHAE